MNCCRTKFPRDNCDRSLDTLCITLPPPSFPSHTLLPPSTSCQLRGFHFFVLNGRLRIPLPFHRRSWEGTSTGCAINGRANTHHSGMASPFPPNTNTNTSNFCSQNLTSRPTSAPQISSRLHGCWPLRTYRCRYGVGCRGYNWHGGQWRRGCAWVACVAQYDRRGCAGAPGRRWHGRRRW